MRKQNPLAFAAIFALALGATALAQPTPQHDAITVWKNGMPPGGITQKADFGDHLLEVIHRNASGQCEIHKTKADVIVIQKGSATLLTGGEAIDAKQTEANELRGSGIKGGVKHEVGPGDIIDVPAGVPHQFLLAPGTEISYFVVKVVKH